MEKKSIMYLLYDHVPQSKWTHTLCRIDLLSPAEAEAEAEAGGHDVKRKRISMGTNDPLLWERIIIATDAADRQVVTPILKIKNDGKNAREMRCACLGSKLYLLGGVIKKKADGEIFPREVRVLDLKTHQWHTLDSKLNSGKPCPIVFAANGKLYALADLRSACSLQDPYDVRFSIQTALSKLNVFECYDPETDQWRVLDDPPINRHARWYGFSVLNKHGKVVLYGRSEKGNVQLEFDLEKEKWAVEPIPLTEEGESMYESPWEEGDGMSVYKIESFRGLPNKSKFGISFASPSNPRPHDAWNRMRMDKNGINDELWNPRRSPIPDMRTPAKLLRYAGDNYFYYIVSAVAPCPQGYDPFGVLYSDQDTHFIDVLLLKDLGGRNFKTKAICRQTFEIKSPLSGLADLVNCHLIEVPNGVVDEKNARPFHTGLGWRRKFCYDVGNLLDSSWSWWWYVLILPVAWLIWWLTTTTAI